MCYAEYVYNVLGQPALFHVASSANPDFGRAVKEILDGSDGIMSHIGKMVKCKGREDTVHTFFIPRRFYRKCDGSCTHGGPIRIYCGART